MQKGRRTRHTSQWCTCRHQFLSQGTGSMIMPRCSSGHAVTWIRGVEPAARPSPHCAYRSPSAAPSRPRARSPSPAGALIFFLGDARMCYEKKRAPMPACLTSELCDIGDGRVGTVSCWMPARGGGSSSSDAEGMLVLRVGSGGCVYPGVLRVTRTSTHVCLLFSSGNRWELRLIGPSRL